MKKLDTDYILFDETRGMRRFCPEVADNLKFMNPEEGQEIAYEVSGGMQRADLCRDAALACALYVKQGREIDAGTAFAFVWQLLGLDGKAELQKARKEVKDDKAS